MPSHWLFRNSLPVCISGLSALGGNYCAALKWFRTASRNVTHWDKTASRKTSWLLSPCSQVLIILRQKLALIQPVMNPPSFSLADIFRVWKGSGPAGQFSRLPADPLQIAGQEINIEIGQLGENGMSLRLILGTSRCQDFTI